MMLVFESLDDVVEKIHTLFVHDINIQELEQTASEGENNWEEDKRLLAKIYQWSRGSNKMMIYVTEVK